ncbi:MAG TPA: NADPH-dependent glutamate synthase [Candidatus Ozemobacteraceae bacterium]
MSANSLTPQQRMALPRQKPLEQDPKARSRNFQEVCFGFDEGRAREEAKRCLECKNALCVKGCPVGVNIPAFIAKIVEKDYVGAVQKIREQNYLPAVCGRVCPQEMQCESQCVLGKKHEPVSIGKLERFVADYEMQNNLFRSPVIMNRLDRKVAVVGSGPAGLTCAAELAKLGYQVTVFEALHAVGGVLRYGIPEFRLPKAILDTEMERIKALGVKVVLNFVVGRTATLDELCNEMGYEAIFLGTGAGTPKFLDIPGESLSGVYSANEFLTRVNLMKAYGFPEADTPIRIGKRVAVCGGGNTAMDAVRTAMRLGAEKAYLVYRRTRAEMPARVEEIMHAEEEGIEFMFMTNPLEVLGDEKNWVKGLRLQKMEMGEPDASGRRKPVPVKGSEFVLEVETLVEAIGQAPNPIIQATTPGLNVTKWGTVVVDEKMTTSRPNVYAGGDLITGGSKVILAMQDGQKAAASIHEYLQTHHK